MDASSILHGHRGCVNAIAFSRHDARQLVSGGDDTRLLLWNVLEEACNATPVAEFDGVHRDNILSVSWAADNRSLASCAIDGRVAMWDVACGRCTWISAQNTDPEEDAAAVFKVDMHPENSALLVAAARCTGVRLWDVRASNERPQCTLLADREASSASFNPENPVEVLCTTGRHAGIVDLRNASPNANEPPECFSTNFVTTLARYARRSPPSPSRSHIPLSLPINSAAFSGDGSRIVVLCEGFFPLIFGRQDPQPLLVLCDAAYKDTHTFKTAAFAGRTSRELVVCGSNNACACVWDVDRALAEGADSLESRSDAPHLSHALFWRRASAPDAEPLQFAGGRSRIFVPHATSRLTGYASFVNSVAAHPTLPLLATSGVERTVKLHASVPLFSPTDESHNEALSNEDPLTLALFAHLVTAL